MFSFSAIKHTTILLLAMLFMAGAWSIGRLPGAKLLMVTFTFLSSVRLADIRNFRERLQLALIMASCASAAQFLLSISWQQPLLQMLLSAAFAFFVFLILPDRRDGCIVLITGYLALSARPGWFPAISRSIDIFTGIIVIMAVTYFGSAGQTEKKEVQPLPCSTHQALMLAAELGIGTLLFRLLQLKQGAWIMLTILFTVMSETPENSGEKLAIQRVAAVPVGIIAGGFLLETFFRMDYRLFYLIPSLFSSFPLISICVEYLRGYSFPYFQSVSIPRSEMDLL